MRSVEEIKTILKSRKITYEQLSEMSGIPKNSLNQIFRGRVKNPRIDTMNSIYAALGLSDGPSYSQKSEIMELYDLLDKEHKELAKAYIYGLLASEDKAFFDTVRQKMVLKVENGQ